MNRELTVPHTVVLPIELYPPLGNARLYVIILVKIAQGKIALAR